MQVIQISVFLENKAGRLSEVTRILSEANINIRALCVADTTDFGVLRLIVNDNSKAEEALKHHGFTVRKSKVVAVKVPDRPGGLHQILEFLHQANINIEYMYAFVHQTGDNAVMIFKFDDIEKPIAVLKNNNYEVLDGDALYAL
jgi:hypothetical protein